MFTYALRAVILIGIFGWYSIGVWKMIDIYFKDKFEKYLREEFMKNPRIKADLDEYRAKQNKIDGTIQITPNVKDNIGGEDIIDHKNSNEDELFDKSHNLHTIEINVEGNREISTSFSWGGNNDIDPSRDRENIETITKVANQKPIPSSSRTYNKEIGQSIEPSDSTEKEKSPIKIVTITEEDFKMHGMNIPRDYDYSDFDYSENEGSTTRLPGGIAIAFLPYKPNADLGHLNSIAEDEYCSFKLDYQGGNCKNTKKWS